MPVISHKPVGPEENQLRIVVNGGILFQFRDNRKMCSGFSCTGWSHYDIIVVRYGWINLCMEMPRFSFWRICKVPKDKGMNNDFLWHGWQVSLDFFRKEENVFGNNLIYKSWPAVLFRINMHTMYIYI